MLLVELRRISICAFFVVCCVPATLAQSIAGLHGGTFVVNSTGDQITSLTNDDGSVVHYQYDSAGVENGMTLWVRGVSLSLQYSVGEDGSGWLQAGSLPMLMYTSDTYGRTASAILYPGVSVVGGEWSIDVSAADPILAASFNYGPAGHLSAVTLDNGMSLQLGTPAADGVVAQSLIRPNGTVAASASPQGGTDGVNVVPAQLDAIATRFGLGADWAETMTFTMAASGHVTTGRDASGAVRLYLVDAGPLRVGYAPDGTALFYDFMPSYTNGEMTGDPAAAVAAIVPSHIVMTGEGAAGLYTDRPAYGAVYTAWTETNAAGETDTRFATIEPAPTSSSRSVATEGRFLGRFRVKSERIIRIKTTVCVDDYCWVREWTLWVDDPTVYSGGSPSGGSVGSPPAVGGSSPRKPGNQVVGDTRLRAKVERGLNKAQNKLQDQTCKALLERIGVDNKKLIDVMTARGYTDPGKYLANLTYVTGNAVQCAGNPMASTNPYASIVAICRSFGNATDGMASVYLIHEMMHTLGYGESPQIPGFPTSSQITDAVGAACGRN